MANKEKLERQLSASLVESLHNYMDALNGDSCTKLYHTTHCLIEKELLKFSLEKCNGNISTTAKLLGISRTTLIRKLATHTLKRK